MFHSFRQLLSLRKRPARATKTNPLARKACLLLERLEERAVPAFALRLEQAGFSPLLITDNSALDQDPAAGVIAFVGSYGTFQTSIASVISKPIIGDPSTAVVETHSHFNTSIGGRVVFSVSDTDFTVPGAGANPLTLTSNVGGIGIGAACTYQGYADPDNNLFGTAVTLGGQGPFAGPAFSSARTVSFNRAATPYSLSTTAIYDMAGSGVGGADHVLTVTGSAAQPAALGDFVWHDLDADGIQDTGEPGIPNATVNLKDANGDVIATTTTDANGLYLFSGLTPGTYSVQFVQPAGYASVSPANQGANDAVDSDANPAMNLMTQQVTLAAGETNTTLDAGFFNPAALGDFVWEDLNANGIQDAGEPGIPGITVKLLDATGTTVLATTNTDANGLYLFSGLTPGTYTVMFVPPAGYAVSPKDQGANDAIDSDADTVTGTTGQYTLASGETNLTVDAGLFQPTALGDFVWHDLDVDGVQDAGEPGIPGVTVQLLDAAGNVLATTTTDANGRYLFSGLTPGSYRVQFVAPAGFVVSPRDQGADDGRDSDASPLDGGTGLYTLASGETNLTVDAGVYRPAPPPGSSLSGSVYVDRNNNGRRDAGEIGIPGVVVVLTGTDVTGARVVSTVVTNGTGDFLFRKMRAGTYRLTERHPVAFVDGRDTAGLLGGQVANDTIGGISLGANQHGRAYLFGERGLSLAMVSKRLFITGSNWTRPVGPAGTGVTNVVNLADPSGFVYVDRNGNGRRDRGEVGIAGVLIELRGVTRTGTVVSRFQRTDARGFYRFDNLEPGVYSLIQTQPTGYRDGRESLGTLGGIVKNDRFTQIVLTAGAVGYHYNFGELLARR